jgi:predicted transcriptional regulator
LKVVMALALREDLLRAIEQLEREEQLNLAQWILGMEEKDFDMQETPEDLRTIRRGLEQLDRGETVSAEMVRERLLARRQK